MLVEDHWWLDGHRGKEVACGSLQMIEVSRMSEVAVVHEMWGLGLTGKWLKLRRLVGLRS